MRLALHNIWRKFRIWFNSGWELYGDKLQRRRVHGGYQYRCCGTELVGVDGVCPTCQYKHGYLPGANTPEGQGHE